MSRKPDRQPPPSPASLGRSVLAALVLAAAGTAVYWNSFSAPLVFDGKELIVDRPPLGRLWPPWAPLVDSNRPIGFLTFAANHALHGTDVWGYHAVNLAIHVAAAWVLLAIVRRTLSRRPPLAARYAKAAWGLALASALLWLVHPLQTQSVTYIYQRLESLMGLFYLLTLYFFIRGIDAARPGPWYAASITCCALGMGTKEVMITAPLMVLWYDRALVAQTWREIFDNRGRYYAGLAGTWSILAVIMLSQVDRYTAGDVLLVQNVSPIEYALSQPGVILQYLRLSFWPTGQCLDYGWPVAESAEEIVPPLVIVGALLGFTLWCAFRRLAWGFLGGWFFLILAPTSSIAPIKDLAFEHRMYLPLAALVVAAVVLGYEILARLVPPDRAGGLPSRIASLVTLGVVLPALGYLTIMRNHDHRTPESIWQDTVDKRPQNARAHNNLGNVNVDLGRYSLALAEYNKAIGLKPGYAAFIANRGNAYRMLDQPERALADYDEAIALKPEVAQLYFSRAAIFVRLGQTEQALDDYTRALRLKPDLVDVYVDRGTVYRESGHFDLAMADYNKAIELDPRLGVAYLQRGIIYGQSGRHELALAEFGRAIELNPQLVAAYQHRGRTHETLGQDKLALGSYDKAIELKPDDALTYYNRGVIYGKWGRSDLAVADYSRAIEFDRAFGLAYFNRAHARSQLGQHERALDDLTKTIELMPDSADAYYNRAVLHFQQGRYREALADVEMVQKLGGRPSPQFIQKLRQGLGASGDPRASDPQVPTGASGRSAP